MSQPEAQFPFYPRRGEGPIELPRSRRALHADPARYIPDTGLVDAVNAALLLGQPLLLTGEPGTGKTQFAHHLSQNLGLGEALVFEAKSTSVSRDLFYMFDSIARFQAAQFASELGIDGRQYITYNALGLAILYTNREDFIRPFVPDTFVHGGERRSVVLIDEIDKASRDFPNDILNEVELMGFRVPELGNEYLTADESMRPILVMTSNSERRLPEAFLRRCIYYDIPFPGLERLREIVLARVANSSLADDPLLSEALGLFERLRSPALGLRKRPATAELLGWIEYLGRRMQSADGSLRDNARVIDASLGVLIKDLSDHELALREVNQWVKHQS